MDQQDGSCTTTATNTLSSDAFAAYLSLPSQLSRAKKKQIGNTYDECHFLSHRVPSLLHLLRTCHSMMRSSLLWATRHPLVANAKTPAPPRRSVCLSSFLRALRQHAGNLSVCISAGGVRARTDVHARQGADETQRTPCPGKQAKRRIKKHRLEPQCHLCMHHDLASS